ncbi:MAG: hypothetical protein JJ896_10735 [Rhodothermales bacterium]|nr:hypothetical protein [Rhodothermales bacterium]MBO6780117.1 hypothetical protein [Rhodothermales bacterium]
MASLTVDHFLTAGPDMEQAQYRILAGLRPVQEDFARTAIYPHLSDLIELHASLEKLRRQLGEIRDALPTEIDSIDLENNEVVHAEPPRDFGPMGHLGELIEWALPLLRQTIEEGRTIFEFVDSSLRIEQVGILPSYTEEGYLMVPDMDADELCVLRYAMSIVTRSNERYRGLRTSVVKRLPDRRAIPPAHIKLSLAKEQPDLPNPATYYVDADIEFPFDATVMPIAKRKLMRHLFKGGASA